MSKRVKGFTIIELTIALAFLAILMMAILTLTITAGKLYIKGDTMKTINQAGREFSDTVRRDFLASGMGTISDVVTINGGTVADPLYSGRICLGSVTYLWNTAHLLNNTSSPAEAAKVTMNSAPVKVVRIVRPQAAYCTPDPVTARYQMDISSSESATELFGGTEREYALYSLTFMRMPSESDKGLYRASYTLGTNDPNTTELDADGFVTCRPNDSILANFDYCSVTDFDMMMRVGGTK